MCSVLAVSTAVVWAAVMTAACGGVRPPHDAQRLYSSGHWSTSAQAAAVATLLLVLCFPTTLAVETASSAQCATAAVSKSTGAWRHWSPPEQFSFTPHCGQHGRVAFQNDFEERATSLNVTGLYHAPAFCPLCPVACTGGCLVCADGTFFGISGSVDASHASVLSLSGTVALMTPSKRVSWGVPGEFGSQSILL